MSWIALPVKRGEKDVIKDNRGYSPDNAKGIYLVNTRNINYLRKWGGEKGETQTVIYFNATDKYIVVDIPMERVENLLIESGEKVSKNI